MTRGAEIAAGNLGFDMLSLGYVLEEPWCDRVKAAGIDAMNVTFGGEESWDAFRRSVDQKMEIIARSHLLTLALTSEDIEEARVAGKLAVIMGTQGAHILDDRPERVAELAGMGLRVLGIVGSFSNLLCDGSAEPRNAGLTLLGREVINAVNKTPVLIDIAHCGHRASAEIIEAGRAVICSHANAFAVEPTDRNRHDCDAQAMVVKGGMIGLCALPRAIAAEGPSLAQLLDHADHWKRLVGAEYVGLGLDLMEGFRAAKQANPALIRRRTLRPDIFGTMEDFWNDDLAHGINSIAQLPDLLDGLLARGWTEVEVRGVLGGNWLRVFRALAG